MSISSLGVGSGVLTQDILDKLRAVDEGGRVKPIKFSIANGKDKQEAFKIVDASMTNFIDSTNDIKSLSLWNERSATVTSGTSVEVSALANTDIQDFTLDVTALATKQIEQSGAFATVKDVVDTGAGSFDISVGGGTAISIDYAADANLTDIKNLINDKAGSLVKATIVQISSGDFRLFLNSSETGAAQDIKITSASGLDTKLTTDLDGTAVQVGTDSAFTFNGQSITRSSNKVNDLIVGVKISLKKTGVSEVSIAQDRTTILEKFDSFTKKYNESLAELNRLTAVSVEADARGIFSNESTIKSLKRTMQNILDSVGGGVGTIVDYGFEVDKDGLLTLNKTRLESKLDNEPINTKAFFSGGDFTKSDGTVVALTGAFVELATSIESYTKADAILDTFKNALTQRVSDLEDRKLQVIASLDSKYQTLQKKFAAFDILIRRINSSSNIFTQLANQNKN